MKIVHASQILAAAYAANKPVCLFGAPGVGKTAIAKSVAEKGKYRVVISHPAIEDVTDVKGIPMLDTDAGVAHWLPFETIRHLCETQEPTVWIWDDFGNAMPSVQGTLMSWLSERCINGMCLSDHVRIVLTTNDRSHKGSSHGVISTVKSRCFGLIEIEADLDSWTEWAIASDMNAHLIAFVRNRPEFLCEPVADGMAMESSPRALEHLSWALELERNGSLPREAAVAFYSGIVGKGCAMEFIAWRELIKSMISLDEVLANPLTVELPKEPAQLYATSVGLAFRADATTFDAIATFAERLQDAGKGEFAVLTIRDCLRRASHLTSHGGYTRLMAGPLGKLIREVI